MGLRDDWGNPTELDAFKGLMNCQDDNSYYAAVKGFAVYVSNVQQSFDFVFLESFHGRRLRVQNLTQATADMYNTTGCYGAEAGPQCVQQNLAGKALNPNLTQFQIYALNNCADPDTVQLGGWEQAGAAIRELYRDLWQKFVEAYPPQTQPAS